MRRREVIFSGMALTLSNAAWAQTERLPIVAFVTPGHDPPPRYLNAIRRGLSETGFLELRNVAIEHHHFDRRFDQLAELIANLARRRVAVICTITNAIARSVNAANLEIPLVFVSGLDPVAIGLVTAFDRPGRNATGVFFPVTALDPKRLETLRELLPELRLVAVLVNPTNPNAGFMKDLKVAAHGFGLDLLISEVQSPDEMDAAFALMKQRQAGAVLVTSDPIFEANRDRVFELTAQNALPAIYPWREYVDAGGLSSYGNNLTDAARLAGQYAGRILKGNKPSDLPVEMQTKFEFVVNLRTAKALGLTIPPSLLARADEVIE